MSPTGPAGNEHIDGGLRWPTTPSTRHSALAILAVAAGLLAFIPGLPSGVSALLLGAFVGVGPGSAVLAWTGRPPVSRLILVPALGLTLTIIITGGAATAGWWSPHALFSMMALMTLWSVIPNLGELVRDMVP